MNYLCKIGIKKIIILLKNKKISNKELLENCFNNIEKINKKNNFSYEIYKKKSFKIANILDKNNEIGIPISVKDIYNIKKTKCSCNSLVLSNYISEYNSNIIKSLKKNNIIIISKDILEEFCLGGTGLNNCNIKNLYNENFLIGGSSNASALNVAYGCCFASIGSDTGGSIRTPSSYNNLIGFKPTNGKISRFGMIPYSSFLDNCSIISNYSEDCNFIYNIINKKNLDLSSNLKKIIFQKKKKKICILEWDEFYPSYEIKIRFENIFKNFEKLNFNIINLKNKFKSFINLYKKISSEDFFVNSCKFDGIKFGFKKKIYKNINDFIKLNRIFSEDCKNKIFFGYDYFNINNDSILKIINHYLEIFNYCNFLIIPTNIFNLKIEEKKYSSYIDLFTYISNIVGFPTININMGFVNHIPCGFQIISEKNTDLDLLNLSILYEKNFFKKYVFN